MTIKEFYDQVNGSYNSLLERIGSEERAAKYLKMLKLDPSYNELKAAIERKDFETAFRSIHTLKGVSLNLALDSLYEASVTLTEIFRHYSGEDYHVAYDKVSEVYEKIMSAIDLLD